MIKAALDTLDSARKIARTHSHGIPRLTPLLTPLRRLFLRSAPRAQMDAENKAEFPYPNLRLMLAVIGTTPATLGAMCRRIFATSVF